MTRFGYWQRAALGLALVFLIAYPQSANAQALSSRGKRILDRFDQKSSRVKMGVSLQAAVRRPIKIASGRRGHGSPAVDRFLQGQHTELRSLTKLLEPFPAQDKGAPRYKKTMRWLKQYEAQIATWTSEYDGLKQGKATSGKLTGQLARDEAAHKELLTYLRLADRHPGDHPDAARALGMWKRVQDGELKQLVGLCKTKYAPIAASSRSCPVAGRARAILATHIAATANTLVGAELKKIKKRTGVYKQSGIAPVSFHVAMTNFDAWSKTLRADIDRLYSTVGKQPAAQGVEGLRAARNEYLAVVDARAKTQRMPKKKRPGKGVVAAATKALRAHRFDGKKVAVVAVHVTTDWQTEVNALGVKTHRMQNFVALVKTKGQKHCLQISGGAGHAAAGRGWAKLAVTLDGSGITLQKCSNR